MNFRGGDFSTGEMGNFHLALTSALIRALRSHLPLRRELGWMTPRLQGCPILLEPGGSHAVQPCMASRRQHNLSRHCRTAFLPNRVTRLV
jgi:hypothetical protein